MLADFIRTFGMLLLIVLATIAVLLLIIAIKVLCIKSQKSKIAELADDLSAMSKERSDLKVYAYSMRCENDVHLDTIRRKDQEIDRKDTEIKTLKEAIETLSAGIPVPPEGFRFVN